MTKQAQKPNFLALVLSMAVASGFLFAPVAFAMPTTADVIVLVDESVSIKASEIAWLGDMVLALDTALIAEGITGNRFGLGGFVENTGAHGPGSAGPHKHVVGSGDFGSATEFDTATASISPSGSVFEDGFEAIDFALSSYTFRGDAAVNFILLTDEDRDDTTGGAVTATTLLADLAGIKVNAIVNNPFTVNGSSALGLSGTGAGGFGYTADGSGGFVKDDCATETCAVGNGAGSTESDYVPFAFDSGGAAWNLNVIDDGGLTVDSFTAAFVDLKVEEIMTTDPVIPEPSTVILFGSGLVGLAAWRRFKKNA